jgi:hypothetical protein
MAIPADRRGGDIGIPGFFHPIVAIPAIDSELRGVDAVGKSHGLNGLITDTGVFGREIISDPGGHGGAGEEGANNDIARKFISTLWKNVRHLSLYFFSSRQTLKPTHRR